MDGWIKLHRTITDSAVFDDPEILKIWIWLLCNAAFADHETIFNGSVLQLKAGELITGRKKMSQKLGISEGRIYRGLLMLKKLGNINIKTNNKYSIIRIENWAKFQQDSASISGINVKIAVNKTANDTANEQQMDSKPTANEHNIRMERMERKERKERKKRKKELASRGELSPKNGVKVKEIDFGLSKSGVDF